MNIRNLLLIPIMVLALISCSKENDNLELQSNTRKTAITDYLDDFYDDPYTYGTPITTEDENDVEFSFKAITVDGEERGYLATNTAGTVTYFVDVDRDNYILTTYDFQSGEEKVASDIDDDPEYSSTYSYDFKKVVEDVEAGLRSKGRFIGYGDPIYNGPCLNGFKSGYQPYYFFWFNTKKHSKPAPLMPC